MIKSGSIRFSLRSAWDRVNRLWKPMALWTLLVWGVVTAILSPLTSLLLGMQLFRGDLLVIANETLLEWLLSPAGLLWLLMAGALTLTGTVMQFSGIFQIIADDLAGRRTPGIREKLISIFTRLPRYIKASLYSVIGAGLLLTPLLLGLGGIHLLLLGEHDINYYPIMQPAEWYYALIAGGLWITGWLFTTLWIVERSLPALPAYLSEPITVRQAIRHSWGLTRERHLSLVKQLLPALLITTLIIVGSEAVLLLAASQIIEQIAAYTDTLHPVVLATGGYMALSRLLNLLLSFLGFAFVSAVISQFYFEESGLSTRRQRSGTTGSLTVRAEQLLQTMLRPTGIIFTILLLLCLSIGSSFYLLDQLPEQREVTVFAHRAGPPPAPENTLSALEAAIEAGAEYTEIDVQLTGDGVPVLLHDQDLIRVTGDPRRIADVTRDEIRDLIQRPDDGTPEEERRLVTLGDFLERARGRIGVMIELKYYHYDPDLAPRVIEEIHMADMADDVMLMSLDLRGVNQIRELDPELHLGYLSAITVGDLSRLPVDFLAVSRQITTPGLVTRAHRIGLPVYVWTVNRADRMADLIDMGADGLITDDPGLALQVRRELATMTVGERLLLRFRSLVLPDDDDSEEPAL